MRKVLPIVLLFLMLVAPSIAGAGMFAQGLFVPMNVLLDGKKMKGFSL